jgi:uncharacterized RDD family membrane protein YckC
MNTNTPHPLLQTALEKAQQCDFNTARTLLEQILTEMPGQADVYFYLGVVCQKQGDLSAAELALRHCLEIEPFHPTALQVLKTLSTSVTSGGNDPFAPQPVQNPATPFVSGLFHFTPVQIQPVVQVRRAGMWIRIRAFVVDLMLVFILSHLVGSIALIPYNDQLAEINRIKPEEMVEMMLAGHYELLWILLEVELIGMVVFCSVALLFYSYYHFISGQTPGKRLVGIRVVDEKSMGYLTAGQSMVRFLGVLLNWACCGLGYLGAANPPDHRTMQDYFAKTLVVYTEPIPSTMGELLLTAFLTLFLIAYLGLSILSMFM